MSTYMLDTQITNYHRPTNTKGNTIISTTHFKMIAMLGQTRAINEQLKGKRKKANDNLWENLDPQELIFQVTGEKLDPDTNDVAVALIDSYETAYYDQYEDEDSTDE